MNLRLGRRGCRVWGGDPWVRPPPGSSRGRAVAESCCAGRCPLRCRPRSNQQYPGPLCTSHWSDLPAVLEGSRDLWRQKRHSEDHWWQYQKHNQHSFLGFFYTNMDTWKLLLINKIRVGTHKRRGQEYKPAAVASEIVPDIRAEERPDSWSQAENKKQGESATKAETQEK